MKVKTKDLELALNKIKAETGGTTYIYIKDHHGGISLSAQDMKACEKEVIIYGADTNMSPKFKTESILTGLKK